ncbi:putative n6-adenine methyltransferase domain-containing protein [Phthorimaea operculella]|nr:putative n6-adenine methyltransferase domain-containing protein [Phthorimaea operculella]
MRWPRQIRGGRGQRGDIRGVRGLRGHIRGVRGLRGQIPRGPYRGAQTSRWPRQRGQQTHWPRKSGTYRSQGVTSPTDDIDDQEEYDDWSEENQNWSKKSNLTHHRRYETDTFPQASTSYDDINEELDEYNEPFFSQGQAKKKTGQWNKYGADDGEPHILTSFFKENYIKYTNQKKRFALWMSFGYTKEEAASRCFRSPREFPEYHERKFYPGIKDLLYKRLIESCNKSGEVTFDRICIDEITTAPNRSTHDKQSSLNNKDPNYIRKLEKRRKLFWLSHGYSEEEAKARSHRQFKEFPEFKKLKAAGKTASFATAQKLKFHDLEDHKTKTPVTKDITIAIIDDNNDITKDKIKLIEKEIIRCIEDTSSSPNFTSYTIKNGCLILGCEDGDTRDWLIDNIANFNPWEGASLRVIEEDELPTKILAIIKTSNHVPPKVLLNRLAVQNEDVGCERWKIYSQLSQFWYDEATVNSLVRVVDRIVPDGGKVALISCPTLFVPVKRQIGERATVSLLEYDRRFEVHAPDFIFYDYNFPDKLPSDLAHTYDLVVADPPFLAEECITKTSETIKLLAKDKIVVCTGAIMKEHVEKLLGLKLCRFQPHHRNNLANEFSCYANFDLDSLLS